MDGLEAPVQALLIGAEHRRRSRLTFRPSSCRIRMSSWSSAGSAPTVCAQVAAHHSPVPFAALVEQRRERVRGRRAMARRRGRGRPDGAARARWPATVLMRSDGHGGAHDVPAAWSRASSGECPSRTTSRSKASAGGAQRRARAEGRHLPHDDGPHVEHHAIDHVAQVGRDAARRPGTGAGRGNRPWPGASRRSRAGPARSCGGRR